MEQGLEGTAEGGDHGVPPTRSGAPWRVRAKQGPWGGVSAQPRQPPLQGWDGCDEHGDEPALEKRTGPFSGIRANANIHKCVGGTRGTDGFSVGGQGSLQGRRGGPQRTDWGGHSAA